MQIDRKYIFPCWRVLLLVWYFCTSEHRNDVIFAFFSPSLLSSFLLDECPESRSWASRTHKEHVCIIFICNMHTQLAKCTSTKTHVREYMWSQGKVILEEKNLLVRSSLLRDIAETTTTVRGEARIHFLPAYYTVLVFMEWGTGILNQLATNECVLRIANYLARCSLKETLQWNTVAPLLYFSTPFYWKQQILFYYYLSSQYR